MQGRERLDPDGPLRECPEMSVSARTWSQFHFPDQALGETCFPPTSVQLQEESKPSKRNLKISDSAILGFVYKCYQHHHKMLHNILLSNNIMPYPIPAVAYLGVYNFSVLSRTWSLAKTTGKDLLSRAFLYNLLLDGGRSSDYC